jgi:putative alpha-1,2-mannosidase
MVTIQGTLKIVAYNNSNSNVYVQKVIVNGKPLAEPFLDHSDIIGNSLIEFYMTSTPQKLFQ